MIRAARLLMFDASRADRSLSTFAGRSIRQRFRDNKNVVDNTMKKIHYQKAIEEFSHMKSLIENQSITKYPCSIRIIPEVVQKSKILLSSTSQDRMKKKKWGFMDRLMVVFTKQ
ncbi:hypothetical protein SAMD00019534_116880, partial [Acytostelium subglobosum LB1]|uniref:hypothetical protein n=1 Tax=Acytostelium subglobosum LB1 TaxID=1410327 RepID=UPI000644CEDE